MDDVFNGLVEYCETEGEELPPYDDEAAAWSLTQQLT